MRAAQAAKAAKAPAKERKIIFFKFQYKASIELVLLSEFWLLGC